jgi:hypothetical protein
LCVLHSAFSPKLLGAVAIAPAAFPECRAPFGSADNSRCAGTTESYALSWNCESDKSRSGLLSFPERGAQFRGFGPIDNAEARECAKFHLRPQDRSDSTVVWM